MVQVPQDILEWYGDFCWEKLPDLFGHPQCAQLVPSIGVAARELRDLYPADVCKEMVLKGAGSIVFGLFIGKGIVPGVDDLLLLGTDLALYDGWRERPKLIGQLRSIDAWAAARFEVGVHAGLVRVGLKPSPEPATNKAAKCPDFVVPVDGMTVAIELKAIRDPQTDRNRESVQEELGDLMRTLPYDWRNDVTLHLCDELVAALNTQTQQFKKEHLPRIRAALRSAFSQIHAENHIVVEGVGALTVSDPGDWANEHYAGGYGVTPDASDPDQLIRRALGRADEAARQLGALTADLRIAVIWGGRDSLPATSAAAAADAKIQADLARWSQLPLDWIVFFNGHTLGPNGEWTIDIALCRVSISASPIPDVVLEGITRWGEGRVH